MDIKKLTSSATSIANFLHNKMIFELDYKSSMISVIENSEIEITLQDKKHSHNPYKKIIPFENEKDRDYLIEKIQDKLIYDYFIDKKLKVIERDRREGDRVPKKIPAQKPIAIAERPKTKTTELYKETEVKKQIKAESVENTINNFYFKVSGYLSTPDNKLTNWGTKNKDTIFAEISFKDLLEPVKITAQNPALKNNKEILEIFNEMMTDLKNNGVISTKTTPKTTPQPDLQKKVKPNNEIKHPEEGYLLGDLKTQLREDINGFFKENISLKPQEIVLKINFNNSNGKDNLILTIKESKESIPDIKIYPLHKFARDKSEIADAIEKITYAKGIKPEDIEKYRRTTNFTIR